MNEQDSDSNAPTFDIASLPSVHEHDWRNTSLLETVAETVNLDGETVEDPYSDRFLAKEKEVSPTHQQTQRQAQPQPQTKQIANPPIAQSEAVVNGNKPRVNFEGATTSPEEKVHIKAMFPTPDGPPSSNNNHTNSAQGPSNPSNSDPRRMAGYVPNKYSAHHDPNMPDWEGATIAEHTMADISTLSPPPDDYYNPYVAPHVPPVAMIPAQAISWEDLEETDAERADWKNPGYSKDNSTTSSGEQRTALEPRDRKLIWGLIALVFLLVLAVSIVIPISVKAVSNNNQNTNGVIDENTNNVVPTTPSPSMRPASDTPIPSVMPVAAKTKKPNPSGSVKPDIDETDDKIDDDTTTDDKATVEPETTDPATEKPNNNGRETTQPTVSPISSEESGTPQPNPSPAEVVPESTPEPTPEPTQEPTTKPSKSPISKAPTPSPQSSLLEQNLGERPKQWLEAHNSRRQYYHEDVYGTTYVPLVWSESMAKDAASWAEEQNDGIGCSAGTQGRNDIGQTGYAYWTTRETGFDDPDDVVSWWVDDEADLEWDENSKFTQAIWRASKYLGCGESLNDFQENGRTVYCRIYVCNYITKGNCNMNSYDDWTEPMLMDVTKCGDQCPSEGCYWDAFNIDRMLPLGR
eukprot:scaffold26070_cov71-Cyclotella_meneghiniana.AAC.5